MEGTSHCVDKDNKPALHGPHCGIAIELNRVEANLLHIDSLHGKVHLSYCVVRQCVQSTNLAPFCPVVWYKTQVHSK